MMAQSVNPRATVTPKRVVSVARGGAPPSASEDATPLRTSPPGHTATHPRDRVPHLDLPGGHSTFATQGRAAAGGFNLHSVIREVRDEMTSPDPRMLTKEVNQRIKPADRDTALEQALAIAVYNVISRSRYSTSPDDHAQVDAQDRDVGGGPQRSSKVAGIREAWRRVLESWTNTGPGPGEFKFLGDCTASDLEYTVSINEEHARRTLANAAKNRRLAELIAEHGVTVVRELPDETLARVLGGAA